MQAVSRQEPEATPAPEPQLVPTLGDRMIDSRLVRVLVPMTASAGMVLVVFAVAINMRISGQVDDLKLENASLRANLDASNATMTAHMNDTVDADS